MVFFREDDSKWPQKNKDGRQELEIRLGNEHISFETAKIGSLVDVQESADPEGLRVFYYLVQDLKALVFSLISLHFKVFGCLCGTGCRCDGANRGGGTYRSSLSESGEAETKRKWGSRRVVILADFLFFFTKNNAICLSRWPYTLLYLLLACGGSIVWA